MDYTELAKRLRKTEKICRGRMDGQVMLDAANAIEKMIEKLNHADEQIQRLVDVAEERRWVPAMERLPEQDGACLVTYPLFGITKVTRVAYYTIDLNHMDKYAFPGKENKRPGFYRYDGADMVIEVKDITHWMPLPTPPEEKTE